MFIRVLSAPVRACVRAEGRNLVGEGRGGVHGKGARAEESDKADEPDSDSGEAGLVSIGAGGPRLRGPDGRVLVDVSAVLVGELVDSSPQPCLLSLGVDVRSAALLATSPVPDGLLLGGGLGAAGGVVVVGLGTKNCG